MLPNNEPRGTLLTPGNNRTIRLTIPPKLYGRESEIQILLKGFERTCKGNAQILMVTGAPGIGKTTLVNEIFKPVLDKKGYFISGKYERLKRDAPYSAIMDALKGLVREILKENEENIGVWRNRFRKAFGINGKVITNFIPELELIVGEQPEAPVLDAIASGNRFRLIFESFLQSIGGKNHPVVLFLDDLQWADMASLDMVAEMALNPAVNYIYLIGSYRDTEVESTHPIRYMLYKIEEQGGRITPMALDPLREPDIYALISDVFKCPVEKITSLGKWIYEKTGGNPFFVNHFLKALNDDRLIRFSPETGWAWNEEEIKRVHVTGNIVDFISSRIVHLNDRTQETLKLSACIGNRFELDTLASLTGHPRETLLSDLAQAIDKGLIAPSDETYLFQHDRVRDAAYALIPRNEKAKQHAAIGLFLLSSMDKKSPVHAIFHIVDQINAGLSDITGKEEKEKIPEVYLTAGKKAKAAVAYTQAREYLKTGVALLGELCWKEQYPVALSLYHELAETTFLLGDYPLMETCIDIVGKNARTPIEKIKTFCIRIFSLRSRGDFMGTIRTALSGIHELGVEITDQPDHACIFAELDKAMKRLSGKTEADLLKIGTLSDPKWFCVAHLLDAMGPAAYIADKNMFTFVVLKAMNIYLEQGHLPLSAMAYTAYAAILIAIVGDIDSAYRFGKFGLSLLAKYDADECFPGVSFTFNTLVGPWKDHPLSTMRALMHTYQKGIETGMIEYASMSLYRYDTVAILIDKGLIEVEKNMKKHHLTLIKHRQAQPIQLHAIYWQMALNLIGKSEDPVVLKGEAFNESIEEKRLIASRNFTAIAIMYVAKFDFYYLFYNYEAASAYYDKALTYMDNIRGTNQMRWINNVGSLIMLARYDQFTKEGQEAILKRVDENQKTLHAWKNASPANFLQDYLLVKAERARVLKDHVSAESFYDQAALHCKKHGYLKLEALTNERAFLFHLERGNIANARVYLSNAIDCYRRWQAYAKVEHLETAHGRLFTHPLAGT